MHCFLQAGVCVCGSDCRMCFQHRWRRSAVRCRTAPVCGRKTAFSGVHLHVHQELIMLRICSLHPFYMLTAFRTALAICSGVGWLRMLGGCVCVCLQSRHVAVNVTMMGAGGSVNKPPPAMGQLQFLTFGSTRVPPAEKERERELPKETSFLKSKSPKRLSCALCAICPSQPSATTITKANVQAVASPPTLSLARVPRSFITSSGATPGSLGCHLRTADSLEQQQQQIQNTNQPSPGPAGLAALPTSASPGQDAQGCGVGAAGPAAQEGPPGTRKGTWLGVCLSAVSQRVALSLPGGSPALTFHVGLHNLLQLTHAPAASCACSCSCCQRMQPRHARLPKLSPQQQQQQTASFKAANSPPGGHIPATEQQQQQQASLGRTRLKLKLPPGASLLTRPSTGLQQQQQQQQAQEQQLTQQQQQQLWSHRQQTAAELQANSRPRHWTAANRRQEAARAYAAAAAQSAAQGGSAAQHQQQQAGSTAERASQHNNSSNGSSSNGKSHGGRMRRDTQDLVTLWHNDTGYFTL